MEVVAFAATNIDTHFAIAVSPDISTFDFKRELERTHLSLFPTLGPIKALHLTVKRKSCSYHLTDSLPLKYAFPSSSRTWFLHVSVHRNSICLNKPITTDSVGLQGNDNLTTIASENRRKMENNYLKDQNNPFKEFGVGITTPPRRISFAMKGSPQNNVKSAVGVGRRIMVATNNLRVSPKPVSSLYRRFVSNFPRLSVFEISDNHC